MTSWHYDFNAKKKMASYKLSLNDQMLKSSTEDVVRGSIYQYKMALTDFERLQLFYYFNDYLTYCVK
jgi:hypothetical protein